MVMGTKGKNSKSELIFNDPGLGELHIDSTEEWHTLNWLVEAKKLGLVIGYEYQPPAFELTPKFEYTPLFNNPKQKSKFLLHPHIYTADFKVVLNHIYISIWSKVFKIQEHDLDTDGNIIVYLDTKGTFMAGGTGRSFSINVKLVYEKFNILIQKFVPKEIFKIIGVPHASLATPTGKPSKVFKGYNFIETQFDLKKC